MDHAGSVIAGLDPAIHSAALWDDVSMDRRVEPDDDAEVKFGAFI